MKSLERIILVGKKIILAGVLAVACTSTSYVRKQYTGTIEQQRETAYSDMKMALEDVCADFNISSTGFYCAQHSIDQGWIAVNYQWSEIQQVKCSGKEVYITGEFEASRIYTFGTTWEKINPQCMALTDAMNTYLRKEGK